MKTDIANEMMVKLASLENNKFDYEERAVDHLAKAQELLSRAGFENTAMVVAAIMISQPITKSAEVDEDTLRNYIISNEIGKMSQAFSDPLDFLKVAEHEDYESNVEAAKNALMYTGSMEEALEHMKEKGINEQEAILALQAAKFLNKDREQHHDELLKNDDMAGLLI